MTLLEEIQLRLKRLLPAQQKDVLDFINFLQERIHSPLPVSTEAERGKRIKNAFLKLAELKVFADIQSPVEWQRQIRKDRQLPGREA